MQQAASVMVNIDEFNLAAGKIIAQITHAEGSSFVVELREDWCYRRLPPSLLSSCWSLSTENLRSGRIQDRWT